LMEEDMQGLLEFASRFGFEENSEGYISKCHLCIDIRRHLAAERGFRELQPTEFYEHLE